MVEKIPKCSSSHPFIFLNHMLAATLVDWFVHQSVLLYVAGSDFLVLKTQFTHHSITTSISTQSRYPGLKANEPKNRPSQRQMTPLGMRVVCRRRDRFSLLAVSQSSLNLQKLFLDVFVCVWV